VSRYGPVTLKDNLDTSLADNKFHSVWIRRQNRYKQVQLYTRRALESYSQTQREGETTHQQWDTAIAVG
jgi:hypothetical protein